MRQFKIDREFYEKGVKIFKKSSITLEPGITVLIGCNGYGKSTFINIVKDQLKHDNIEFVSYDNLREGGLKSISESIFVGDITFAGTAMSSPEGESIIMNVGKTVQKISSYIRNNRDSNEYWILLDAVDSGLSIDNIVEIKDFVYNVLFKDIPEEKDIYVVISANSYEMCHGERCLDVREGKYKQFKSYEYYRKYILRTRNIKNSM